MSVSRRNVLCFFTRKLRRKTIILYCEKMFIENGFKEVWVLEGFFNSFVFGFKKTMISCGEENVH